MRRVLALVMISAAFAVVAPAVAGAGGTPADMDVDLVSAVEPLTFSAHFTETDTCVQGDFDAVVFANGDEVTPISATQNGSNPDEFLFVLPSNTPHGELEIQVTCDNGDGTTFGSDTQDWAALAVTKVVSGPAPAGATFTVHAACVNTATDAGAADLGQDFEADLHYTVAGGLHYVYTDHEVDCTLTEPVNGGAASVTIDPTTVHISDLDEDTHYTATVTNTFPAAAVVTQPSFTG